MQTTPNLHLALPEPQDWADIEVLNANLQKIDDFANRKDNPHSVTIAQVGGVNPNLLDNWYFADPINQRGGTSWDASTAPTYGIDRWIAYGGVLAVGNAGIVIPGGCRFSQKLNETLKSTIATHTITMSAMLADGSVVHGTANYEKAPTQNIVVYDGESLTLLIGKDGNTYFETKVSVTLRAVKLELGPTQTLAHQEGETWILNATPNKVLELMKCQRFWNKLDLNAPMFTSADSTSKGQPILLLQYPKMIHTPTITIVGSPGANVQFSSSDACVVKGTNDGGRQYVTILELDADL